MHKITELLLKEKIIYKMNEAYNGVIFPPLIDVYHPVYCLSLNRLRVLFKAHVNAFHVNVTGWNN